MMKDITVKRLFLSGIGDGRSISEKAADGSNYSRAKPVFDTSSGTVTATNSGGISDGAAALLVMEEEKRRP